MELLAAFILGGLIIGGFMFGKAKEQSGYERLRAEVPLIAVHGEPSTFRNWYVAYIRAGKVHYEICTPHETQAIIDRVPEGEPVAYGSLDRVELFRTPDEFRKSSWGTGLGKK